MRKSVRQGRGSAIISKLPHFYQSQDYENLLYGFVETFGLMADATEEDLLRVLRAHWVNSANNEGSQGFDSAQKGDLDKIFALLLENLGGTTQLRQLDRREGELGLDDDALYRERIKELVAVLLKGGSTVLGIRNVVAANLGIFGTSKSAEAARQQIQVVEFLAGAQGSSSNFQTIGLYDKFEVDNSSNPVAATMTLRVRISDPNDFLSKAGYQIRHLLIWNTQTNQLWAVYDGVLEKGDQIEFLEDGSILLNTVSIAKAERFAVLPSGQTIAFRIEANFIRLSDALVLQSGRFTPDSEVMQYKTEAILGHTIFFPESFQIEYNYSLTQLQPATFQVRINWDIPPYTEAFDLRPNDNTRSRIRYIVDKVKAAGVYSEILFVKSKELIESHDVEDRLAIWRMNLKPEDVDMQELSFNSGSHILPDPGGVIHDQQERFETSGVFDFTRFGSRNTFL